MLAIGAKIGANPIVTKVLSSDLEASVNAFLATQVKPDPNNPAATVPKYVDFSDLVFTFLKDGLFREIIKIYPRGTVATKQAAATSAESDRDAAQETALS